MTDPDPRATPGLEPGAGVPPGETPPGEGSTTAETGRPEPPELRRAWGPLPLALIVALAVIVAAMFVVMAVVLIVT
jgi:Family of unknown function (DUF6480)